MQTQTHSGPKQRRQGVQLRILTQEQTCAGTPPIDACRLKRVALPVHMQRYRPDGSPPEVPTTTRDVTRPCVRNSNFTRRGGQAGASELQGSGCKRNPLRYREPPYDGSASIKQVIARR